MKIIIIIVLASAFIVSCTKVDCDNAQVCVKNISSETIYYAWGSSYLGDTLLPGHKACMYVGEVKITWTSESTSTVTFNSTKGNYGIHVDDCYIEKHID